jgi:hypothetical protein
MTVGSLPAFLASLLPPLLPCDRLSLGDGDVVIHAPGFEDRTMAIAQTVEPSPGARAILLDYLPFNPKNRLTDVREALSVHGVEIADEDILKYRRFAPGDFETRLQQRLLIHHARCAIVDISTMSKLEILLVLQVCHACDVDVRVLYSEAAEYGPSKREYDEAKQNNEIHQPTIQVFTGVHGVVRVDSLASVAMQGQPTAALVFMSFNDALTQVLLNTVYPARLFLINGRPPKHSWREEATAWIHDQVRREWAADNPVVPAIAGGVPMPKRVASTLDYRETVALLLELYWKLSANHRLLLAPAGSKLQAVGCYLAKALHPDIHIEYPSPDGFQAYYSAGVGSRWLLKLGQLSSLLSAISNAERHEFLEIPTPSKIDRREPQR